MSRFPVALLAALMRGAPFQPATNIWRAVELTILAERAFPSLARGARLLDLGCGDGEVMRLLRPRLPPETALTGIDPDPHDSALARTSGVYDEVRIAGGEALSFPNASFDAVLSNSVLEHIAPIDTVLAQAARVLKPGGALMATVPSSGFHHLLSGPWIPLASRRSYIDAMDRRLVHVRYWDEAAARDSLTRAGFTDVRAIPYLSREHVRRWENVSRLTGGLVHNLWGAKTAPITIQRSMGLRGRRMPAGMADAAARMLAMGLPDAFATNGDGAGCLLILGRKR